MNIDSDLATRLIYSAPEDDLRLADSRGWLGAIRLRQELASNLQPQSSILDCGGGNGVIAKWLLDNGHRVHLVDLMPGLVASAERALGTRSGFSCDIGDARSLDNISSNKFDAVVALGPYYHLHDPAERSAMFAELIRVVRPGGIVIVEFMGRFNFELWVAHSALDDSYAHKLITTIGSDGNLNNDGKSKRLLLTCHTDTAHEIRQAAATAGLRNIRTIALEGPFWAASVKAGDNLNKVEASRLVAICRRNATNDSFIDLSPHALLIANRGFDIGDEV